MPKWKEYKVLVTFCDARSPRVCTIYDIGEPILEIKTYKRALSEWKGLYNVCELTLLR